MKKLVLFSVMLLASLAARSQNADPQINILMQPPTLQVGTNGMLQVDVINAGSTGIIRNSLEVTIGMSNNGEFLGLAPGSHPAWTVYSLSSGTSNTIILRNTAAGINADSLQVINLNVRANVTGPLSIFTGYIAYIPDNNPSLGGAPNAIQGNVLTANDNSSTSLTVSAGPPLPIDLTSFTGSMNNCHARLNWVANTAKPHSSFTLEQSADGKAFAPVTTLEANSATPSYSYTLKQQSPRSFYRLKLTDRVGSATYSNTISMTSDCMQAEAALSPNPTRGSIRLSGGIKGGSIRVFNQFGAIVIQNPSSADPATVDLSAVPAGLYRVSWETEAGVVTRSVTKL